MTGSALAGAAFADNNTTGAMDTVSVTGSPITRIEAIEVILTATGDIGDPTPDRVGGFREPLGRATRLLRDQHVHDGADGVL